MKNILNKLYFHPIFLISVFTFVLIGKFKFIFYFMLLIIVHEIGHIVVSFIFKWKIEKIIILPFGGLTKFNTIINTPLYQDFIVAISGIILQLVFYFLTFNYIKYKHYGIINLFIILFNILPIYPLDGSKILNVLFNKITNYKNSILLTAILSYITIIVLSLYLIKINKLFFLVLIFLLIEVNKFYKDKELLFNKFILERYLNEFKFKHKKTINNINQMKKDYRHLFFIDNKYITENYFLKIYFDNK